MVERQNHLPAAPILSVLKITRRQVQANVSPKKNPMTFGPESRQNPATPRRSGVWSRAHSQRHPEGISPAVLGSVPGCELSTWAGGCSTSMETSPREVRDERSTCAEEPRPRFRAPITQGARGAPGTAAREMVFKHPESRSCEQKRCPAAARGRWRGVLVREGERGGDPNPKSAAVRPGPTCWRCPSRRALPLGQTLRSWGARGAPRPGLSGGSPASS